MTVTRHSISEDRYVEAMRGIFERRYYTNQGPLTCDFEERLQAFLGVRHAVCVTNGTIGLMMASEALGISGRALLPGIVTSALEHALAWCGVEPVYCDVDEATGHIDMAQLHDMAHEREFGAVIGANLWGDSCVSTALAEFAAANGIPLLFDSSHAFGCTMAGKRIGGFGQIEVLSFGSADILDAAGGACVTTNDDELAARLRNIRSSYGAGKPVPVVKTSNGRMSEAQAAFGLLGLEDYEQKRAHNCSLFDVYRSRLNKTAGIRVIEPTGVDASNHQMLVCAVDERAAGISRDALIAYLATQDVDARAVRAAKGVQHDLTRLPACAAISDSWFMLPLAGHVDETVHTVCNLIDQARQS